MTYRAVRPRDEVADHWFDFWRGGKHLVALGGGATYYGVSEEAATFDARLSHWQVRHNALGVALTVILSPSQDEAAVTAAHTRAVASIPGVHQEQLSVLLWYRKLVKHAGADDDVRRHLLAAMIDLIRRDIWSQPMAPDLLGFVDRWQALVAQPGSAQMLVREVPSHEAPGVIV